MSTPDHSYIETQSLKKTFYHNKKSTCVLDNVNYRLQKGMTSSIVGRSGSGKSTLLSLLAGLDRPDSGEIIINGSRLSQMNEGDLTAFRARHIGIIFQHFHLLPHLTALENVALTLEISGKESSFSKAKDRAAQMLSDVGLGERMNSFPSLLSGGEKQRVAVARALVIKPDILFADEPSGSLDDVTGKEVMGLIFDLVKEKSMTMILVTHDHELADQCDNKLVLERGQLC